MDLIWAFDFHLSEGEMWHVALGHRLILVAHHESYNG